MINTLTRWEKLGRIIAPDPKIFWMNTYSGPSFAFQIDNSSLFDIYVTGRDVNNRSLIGKIKINIENPKEILEISKQPVLTCGELGAFDENGVSYPSLVKHNDKVFMFYVGWMPSVLTPFQNQLGLAVKNNDGTFSRISRAPIMGRNNDDYLCIGSNCALIENGIWKMWYTSFLKWGSNEQEHKHYYVIKHAESIDGINWVRKNQICIDFKNQDEYAIGRPSVLKINSKYHMWYSYRGEQYKIGYAVSDDGISWKRNDELVNIDVSQDGWDSKSICYSQVFQYNGNLYMLYNGNNYGKEGLGLARLKI